MLIFVKSVTLPDVKQSFVAANEQHKTPRPPVPKQKRRCVYRQYEELVPYQQV